MPDGIREYEVAVGQPLHQCARSEAVRPVIREVRFAGYVKPINRAHEIVVHPEPTHRVMDRGIDAHRNLIWILVRDALVHLEQVTVAVPDDIASEPLDRVGEIEINTQSRVTDPPALVAHFLCRAGRDVAWREIAEARILPFEEVISFSLGNLPRDPRFTFLLRNPHSAVVSQRLAHQRELRLVLSANGNAGRMNLSEAWVRECGAPFVRPPDRGRVGALSVGREVEDVPITASGQYDRLTRMRLHSPGNEVS